MRKGPLIAAITLVIIGIGFVITGAIAYTQGDWSDWILWSGLLVFNIGLIVLVTAFIKKPTTKSDESSISQTSN
jgi:protein-S-isoprenylcysteine O-methyltransferase Ste14